MPSYRQDELGAVERPPLVPVSAEKPERLGDYDIVELRYRGRWSTLRLGGDDPKGWEIHGDSGLLRFGRTASSPVPCVLIGRWIFGTSWAEDNPGLAVRERKRVRVERDGEGRWSPGASRSVGSPERRRDHGRFIALDVASLDGARAGVVPLCERRKLLEILVARAQPGLPWIQCSAVWDRKDWEKLWKKQVVRGGWEGLVFKQSWGLWGFDWAYMPRRRHTV